jgi:putative transposase
VFFERNRVLLGLKILGLAFYIQLSSLRRAARALSEVRSVSKTAVWKWVRKFSEKVNVYPSRNALATEQFINEVLKYCEGKPTFIVDNAQWLKQALEEQGLPYNVESFRR